MIMYGGGAYVDANRRIFVYVTTPHGYLCHSKGGRFTLTSAELSTALGRMRRLDTLPELYQHHQDSVRKLVARLCT
jgi:hypothetical protein